MPEIAPPIHDYSFLGGVRMESRPLFSEEQLLLSFSAMNESFHFVLKKNQDLIHAVAVEVDGVPVTLNSLRPPTVYYSNDPPARFTLNEGSIQGSFTTTNGIFNVLSVKAYAISKRSADSDVASPLSRPTDLIFSNSILVHESGFYLGSSAKRDSIATGSCGFVSSNNGKSIKASVMKRAPSPGCGSTKQYVFMGVAADCTYVSAYNGPAGALTQILSDFNQASAVYEAAFNVGLAIIKLNLQSSCNSNFTWNQRCASTYSISERLSDFSAWRGSFTDNAGLWHLMTGCTTSVSGQAVGIAWLRTLCQADSNAQTSATGGTEFVSGTGVSSIVPVEWKVVAHEVGHNFGAVHDCTSSTCPAPSPDVCCACSPNCDCRGQFLMHPTDNAATSQFSPCSIRNICSTLTDPTRISCLQPPGALKALTSNICGNGVKEGSEQCDCGGANCTDPCCDGATCKFKGNAVCADQNDDCCENCQFKKAKTLCRSSMGPCDNNEFCTGNSSECPARVTHPDGEVCSTGNFTGACASGICTSRDSQCQTSAYGIATVGFGSECQLYCATARGQCLQLAGSFIDGTPCGFSGKCSQGTCSNGSLVGSFLDWFYQDLRISIPIVILVGILILTILYNIGSCIFRKIKFGSFAPRPRVSRRELPTIHTAIAQPPTFHGSSTGRTSISREVLSVNASNTSGNSSNTTNSERYKGWVDPSKYNGPGFH